MQHNSSIDYVVLAVFLFFVVAGIFLIWLLITHPWWFLGVCAAAFIFWYYVLHNSSIEIDPKENI